MSDKFVISSSPHFKANTNTTKIMGFVLLALYPQLWAGIKFFGYRAWLVTVVSIVSCVLFEYLLLKINCFFTISIRFKIIINSIFTNCIF